jgi:hypothetical protein
MKDLLLIVVVAFGLLFFFRAFFTPLTEPPSAPVYRPTAAELRDMRVKATRRRMLRWFSLALVVIGAVVLASAFKLFDLVMNWYSVAIIIIAAGVAVFFISFRR